MRCALGAVPLSIVLVCTTPSATLAQTSQKAEARRHYESGLSLVKSKTYGEAIAEFNQAYDMGHGFAVQYDIGRAYVAIDEPVLAIKAMRKYLVEGGKRIASSRRKQVVAEIAKQERLVVSVSVHAELDGAVLKVDGAAVRTETIPHTIPFTMPFGETFDVGVDTRTGVNDADYHVPFRFTGTIDKLTIKLGPEQFTPADRQKAAAAKAKARD